jgi:transcriptional regulator with PAS, ATPase and Fis domain
MSLLKDISAGVQQVAEAISIAVGVEVEIVDDSLTIIGGTGLYSTMIGTKEEAGKLDGNYLYARVLRSGLTQSVADAPSDKFYDDESRRINPVGELAEICTPIKHNGIIIGIIGLVAFNEEQRAILLDKDRSMVTFVEKMADLLAAKAAQQEDLQIAELSRNEMNTVLETAHEGIFAIDKGGYIRQCNEVAATLLKTTKKEIVGKHINRYMLSSPALEIFKTGKGYTEREELYRGDLHVIVTAKPYYSGNEIEGVVISFRDFEEARKLAYHMNVGNIKNTFDDIIGTSEAITRAKNQAIITARGDSTVLITGESGTGKEMFAKAIHYSGPRSGHPFVTVNCGAIPENLLESELFGYEKGAFTGASEKGKIGKFEMADKGTIFLDEIGDMPAHLQVKILHVLQNMKFERVGGNKSIVVDVRVIAATNRNLEEMIKEGGFREDLYYRLSVIPIDIPPLRDRREDISLFMEHFLRKYNTYMNRRLKGFSQEVRDLYMSYEWPGNVRELENAIEYSTNMAFGEIIGLEDVPLRLKKAEEALPKTPESPLTLSDQVKEFEREIILKKFKKYGTSGDAKELVARELGLSRATLYRKLAELDINKKLL